VFIELRKKKEKKKLEIKKEIVKSINKRNFLNSLKVQLDRKIRQKKYFFII
jgi:hypothetical protein